MRCIGKLKKALSVRWRELLPLLKQMHRISGRSYFDLLHDMVDCYEKLGCTWCDYLTHGLFLEKDPDVRASFLFQYEMEAFLPALIDAESEALLEDKGESLRHLAAFIRRPFLDLRRAELAEFEAFLPQAEHFFAKPVQAFGGKGILRCARAEVDDAKAVYERLRAEKRFILEGAIPQHPEMCKLSAHSLNTMRILTAANKAGEPSVVFAAVRASLDENYCDNASLGGGSALVDEHGAIAGPLLAYAPQVRVVARHPLTGTVFEGFKIPFFEEAKAMAIAAARTLPGARLIGWDVAVRPDGPEIVEANSNPSPNLGQTYPSLLGGRGIKAGLEAALGEKLSDWSLAAAKQLRQPCCLTR